MSDTVIPKIGDFIALQKMWCLKLCSSKQSTIDLGITTCLSVSIVSLIWNR